MAPTRNYPMCENSTRYNRTRNFGLYGHAESKKNAKICLPLGITTKSDFVFAQPRPITDFDEPPFTVLALTERRAATRAIGIHLLLCGLPSTQIVFSTVRLRPGRPAIKSSHLHFQMR